MWTARLLLLTTPAVLAVDLQPLPNFLRSPSSLEIKSPAVPRRPWTVAGEGGALLGRQNGKFEAWIWPNKIFSNFSIRGELADYPVPIDVNALAAGISVTPGETVITYSHAAFTVRQHMFAARGPVASHAVRAAVIFEIESARPLDLVFSFTPEMLRMWPAPNSGRPNGEWVAKNGRAAYVLHTDDPKYSAIVAMPSATPGVMVPYQEHPQTFPLELKLHFDPKRNRNAVFPLVYGLLESDDAPAQAASLIEAVSAAYIATLDYYNHFFDTRLTVETPNRQLNNALRWAEISVDQMQVNYKGETGMVAGYYESADSARPGYAWFFGRDTLWTTYAINSYGDSALTRRALTFLLKRQREDGKVMHEFSQSADALDWKATPYFYASADAALLLVTATYDYVRVTGDLDFLKHNWPAVKRAYEFSRAHVARDGIMNNSEGTGWVESWPQGMPYQEIYMAALDCQSARALSRMAALTGETELSASAEAKAKEIEGKIPAEYYDETERFYAFSRNADGSRDNTASVYPAVAWWDGTLSLPKPHEMMGRWGSPEFSTDWGVRDISNRTPFYDPISYHQGSIWPLFTGWASLAEYRAGHHLAGFAHLMHNVNLTEAQDLGSITELLSGDFFQPLGRSSSHQMWSSAMVITPLIRGLFGVSWNAPSHKLIVQPRLPAEWTSATINNLPFGNTHVDLNLKRAGAAWTIQASTKDDTDLCLTGRLDTPCQPTNGRLHTLRAEALPIELGLPVEIPEEGATTSQVKVIGEEYGAHQAIVSLSAPAGTKLHLPVRFSHATTTVDGASFIGAYINMVFPPGEAWTSKRLVFRW